MANKLTKELDFGIQPEKDKAGNMHTGKYFGFTFVEQEIAEIGRESKARKNFKLLEETHIVFTKLFEKRTKAELILGVRECLGRVIGYETCGLLYYIAKSNTFALIVDNQLCTYYPSDLGNSFKRASEFASCLVYIGTAFTEDRMIMFNKNYLEQNLMDIDSPGIGVNVQSCAFIPLHDYNGKGIGVLQAYKTPSPNRIPYSSN